MGLLFWFDKLAMAPVHCNELYSPNGPSVVLGDRKKKEGDEDLRVVSCTLHASMGTARDSRDNRGHVSVGQLL